MASLNKLAEDQWINEISNMFTDLSNHNLSLRLNKSTNEDKRDEKAEKIIQSICNHWFYSEDARDWDGRISHNYAMEGHIFRYTSSGPCTLMGVPDEENVYFRFHPEEQTRRGDERIPSRDFLMSSYPWKNVFLANTMEANTDTWSEAVLSSIEQEKKALSEATNESYNDVDIAYFGLEKDISKGFREVINYSEFVKLIGKNSRLAKAIVEREYSGWAYKLVKGERKKVKGWKIPTKRKARNFIIFIDSLDLGILEKTGFSKGLSALPKIIDRSIVYKNFTASGDWTFPCLFSMHTGTQPQYNFSNFRHDPYYRFKDKEYLESMKHTMGTYYITKSLIAEGSVIDSNNFLTRRIAKAGFSQAGIKSSRNHGWKMGLTHSLDLSYENCSITNITNHIRHFTKKGIEMNIDTFYIDIDCLHRNDIFRRNSGQFWNVDHHEWIKEDPDKYERLLSIFDDIEIEQRRYKDKLIRVDKILGSILDEADPEDNILIFSDHGTQYVPWTCGIAYEREKDSTLSPERIWKPTLLVYAPNNENFNGNGVSEELVNTCDLYSIILSLHGIESEGEKTQSILPQSLGGLKNREFATTFGLTVEANEAHPELSRPNRFELVIRRKGNKGDICSCPAVPLIEGQTLKEITNKMFPEIN